MPHAVTVPEVRASKGDHRLVMLTAYDAPTTRWGEASGADILLVGDSLAMVVLGHDNTLSVTLDEMLHHARAVTRVATRCLVVGDLPFGSYQTGVAEAVRSAIRYLKEGGVQAVKLEGSLPEHAAAVVRAGVPVMGHLGLTPQSVHHFGGYRVQGRSLEQAEELLASALELERAGCFCLVLEGVPAEVAAVVTRKLSIPTIGIGAGAACDGQVLVVHDLLGMSPPPRPRFVRPYADMETLSVEALGRWGDDVRRGRTPTADMEYQLSADAAQEWRKRHPEG